MNTLTSAAPAQYGDETDLPAESVMAAHEISEAIYLSMIDAFHIPVLQPNEKLTSAVRQIIERRDSGFLYFESDPNLEDNNDIVVNDGGTGGGFVINYSVRLFKVLSEYFGPDARFTFSKAGKVSAGYDVVFTVMVGSDTVYFGDMSSGIPLGGQ